MKRLSLVLALGAVLTILALPAAGAARVEPGAADPTKWGWVTVRNTASSGTYTPAARDRGNSSGQSVKVTGNGPGRYTIRFKGLAPVEELGGIALVTAINSAGRHCEVENWLRSANNVDELVQIICFKPNGKFGSSKFSVSFLDTTSDEGPLGYMYSGDPTSSHDPDAWSSYNSSGATNHLESLDVGHELAVMPSIGSFHGNVQVSSLRTVDILGDLPATCVIDGALPFESDHQIDVKCVDALGFPVDKHFNVVYTRNEGLKGHGQGAVAYLHADQPEMASYVPVKAYRYSSAGKKPTITRSSEGTYLVSLPGMPAGGAVQVSSFRPGTWCGATSIRTTTPQKIGVRCWVVESLTPIDARFSLSYER